MVPGLNSVITWSLNATSSVALGSPYLLRMHGSAGWLDPQNWVWKRWSEVLWECRGLRLSQGQTAKIPPTTAETVKFRMR